MGDYSMSGGRGGVPSVMTSKLCDWAGLTLGGDVGEAPPPAAVPSKGRGRAMVQPHFLAATPLTGTAAGSGRPIVAAPAFQPPPVIPAVSSIQAPGVTTPAHQASPGAPAGSSSGWPPSQSWGFSAAGAWHAQPDYSHFGRSAAPAGGQWGPSGSGEVRETFSAQQHRPQAQSSQRVQAPRQPYDPPEPSLPSLPEEDWYKKLPPHGFGKVEVWLTGGGPSTLSPFCPDLGLWAPQSPDMPAAVSPLQAKAWLASAQETA